MFSFDYPQLFPVIETDSRFISNMQQTRPADTTDMAGVELNLVSQTMPEEPGLVEQTEDNVGSQTGGKQQLQKPLQYLDGPHSSKSSNTIGAHSKHEDIKRQDSTSTSEELLAQFQCGICFESVSDVRLCPNCSNMFCGQCIGKWIEKRNSQNCPFCRQRVTSKMWVKGYSINQIQESVHKLVSCMDHRDNDLICKKHENKPILLFCQICEESMCVICMYAKEHAEHRQHTVPMEEAFENFQKELKSFLQWAAQRKEEIDKQMLQDKLRLDEERNKLEDLCKKSETLVDGQPHPVTLLHTIEIDRALAQLRRNYQDNIKVMRVERGRDMVPEPTMLVFRMKNFYKTILNNNSYEMSVKDPYGCEWKCTIDEHRLKRWFGSGFSVYLSLIRGKPCQYSVVCGNQLEQVHQFDLDEKVEIGTFAADKEASDDTQELTVQIYQSYAACIEQLQNTVEQLEKQLQVAQNANQSQPSSSKRQKLENGDEVIDLTD